MPGGFNWSAQHSNLYRGWSVEMKQRRRIYYSAGQRSEIWDRWAAGEPMSSIGRRFDRGSSSVFSVISPTGGVRPPALHPAPPAPSPFDPAEESPLHSTSPSSRGNVFRYGP